LHFSKCPKLSYSSPAVIITPHSFQPETISVCVCVRDGGGREETLYMVGVSATFTNIIMLVVCLVDMVHAEYSMLALASYM